MRNCVVILFLCSNILWICDCHSNNNCNKCNNLFIFVLLTVISSWFENILDVAFGDIKTKGHRQFILYLLKIGRNFMTAIIFGAVEKTKYLRNNRQAHCNWFLTRTCNLIASFLWIVSGKRQECHYFDSLCIWAWKLAVNQSLLRNMCCYWNFLYL